jgi:hypothetical protein
LQCWLSPKGKVCVSCRAHRLKCSFASQPDLNEGHLEDSSSSGGEEDVFEGISDQALEKKTLAAEKRLRKKEEKEVLKAAEKAAKVAKKAPGPKKAKPKKAKLVRADSWKPLEERPAASLFVCWCPVSKMYHFAFRSSFGHLRYCCSLGARVSPKEAQNAPTALSRSAHPVTCECCVQCAVFPDEVYSGV